MKPHHDWSVADFLPKGSIIDRQLAINNKVHFIRLQGTGTCANYPDHRDKDRSNEPGSKAIVVQVKASM